MAKRKQKTKTKTGGGYQVTLTHDFVYENGLKLKAGKTYTVTGDFYEELKEGGFLNEAENKSETKK